MFEYYHVIFLLHLKIIMLLFYYTKRTSCFRDSNRKKDGLSAISIAKLQLFSSEYFPNYLL
jgi:hypothetical protein